MIIKTLEYKKYIKYKKKYLLLKNNQLDNNQLGGSFVTAIDKITKF